MRILHGRKEGLDCMAYGTVGAEGGAPTRCKRKPSSSIKQALQHQQQHKQHSLREEKGSGMKMKSSGHVWNFVQYDVPTQRRGYANLAHPGSSCTVQTMHQQLTPRFVMQQIFPIQNHHCRAPVELQRQRLRKTTEKAAASASRNAGGALHDSALLQQQ